MYIHMRVEQAVSSRTNPQHSALCRIIHVLPCTSETLRVSINNSTMLQNGQTNPLFWCICLCPACPPRSSPKAPPLESESARILCAGPIFTHEYIHTRAGSGRVCEAVGVGSRAPGCVHVCLFTQRTHTLSKDLGTNTCTGARTQISNEPQNLEPRG